MIPVLKKHFFLLIVAVVGILVLVLPRDVDQGVIPEDDTVTAASDHSSTDTPLKNEQSFIMVDVKGEVRAPGVYEAEPGMRVHDLIDQAGGSQRRQMKQLSILPKKFKMKW
ncbi:hypothetical protein JNUCC1_03449 [Lentibacillus sp. JNUCC-1]|uniref:SLBB domain-containing protein n=1 Tax=Lentibacillus sp. JNUCC-1 TaxID=2654513 RepID=UPI00132BBFDD|nr:SLBB domain-containing protein [Lentibacillus sp. JNUCC-1]MUV39571.1 hypothetical protein [Lentibacillus sp. JNUCC-1]